MRAYPILFFIIIAMSTIQAQEQKGPKFGEGIVNLKGKDSTWTMKVGLQLQFRALAEWEEDTDFADTGTKFLIRRARLKLDGFAYSPKLTYKIVVGFSNSDIEGASEYTSQVPRHIIDAVMKWNFYENFELWFGQTKLPGNRDHLISSSSFQLVDQSLLTKSYNIDRDLGFQLHHHFKFSEKFIIKEAFALSQGEGRNVTVGNLGGLQYTSRLEILPFGNFIKNGDYVGGDIYREETPKLALGVTYDFNNNAVKTRSNQGAYMTNDIGFFKTDISTWFIDGMFKYQGMSVMAEYAKRTAADPYAKNSDGSLTGDNVKIGQGWNFQAGYLFQNHWEIAGRFTNLNVDSNLVLENSQNQYTLGLSKYLVGHQLKVQSDVSYLTMDNRNDLWMWRLQFAIHF